MFRFVNLVLECDSIPIAAAPLLPLIRVRAHFLGRKGFGPPSVSQAWSLLSYMLHSKALFPNVYVGVGVGEASTLLFLAPRVEGNTVAAVTPTHGPQELESRVPGDSWRCLPKHQACSSSALCPPLSMVCFLFRFSSYTTPLVLKTAFSTFCQAPSDFFHTLAAPRVGPRPHRFSLAPLIHSFSHPLLLLVSVI